MFETVVRHCMRDGLVGSDDLVIYASFMEVELSHARWMKPGSPLPGWSDPAVAAQRVRDCLRARRQQHASGRAQGGPAAPEELACDRPRCGLDDQGRPAQARFAYGVSCLIDMERVIVVEAEAAAARWTQEAVTTHIMIGCMAEHLGLRSQSLAPNAAYGSAILLEGLVERGIAPHIPILDRYQQSDGWLTWGAFTYDPERNV